MGYGVEFGVLGLFVGGVASLWAMGLRLGAGVISGWCVFSVGYGVAFGGWGYFWVVCLLCGLWG